MNALKLGPRVARKERGAALVVGLILMLVLTVLGVSGMTASVFGLTMASNAEFQQNAFQAAETAIDIALDRRDFTTVSPSIVPPTPLGDGTYEASAITTFQETTPVPDHAFSMGEDTGAVRAFHFDVLATGRGPDNAASVNNQSFYIVGPGGS
jgi:type IV pilus assembly protein PilX